MYARSKNDEMLALLYVSKGFYYRRLYPDSEFYYGDKALKIAIKLKNKLCQIYALDVIQYYHWEQGNMAEALNLQLRLFALAKELKLPLAEGLALNYIGNTYADMGALPASLNYYRQSLTAFHKMKQVYWELNERSNIGNVFEKLNKPDSALFYEEPLYRDKRFPLELKAELACRIGNAKVKQGKYDEALSYYKKGLVYGDLGTRKIVNDIADIDYQLARLYLDRGVTDSAGYYAHEALNTARSISFGRVLLESSQLLDEIYSRQNKKDSAYYYLKMATKYNDMLFGAQKFNRIQQILSAEQQRQQKLMQEQEELKSRYRLIGSIAGFTFVFIVALLIWRNNLSERKKNKLLAAQKEQLTEQRDELQDTLLQLKQTQQHLIQSEKMASLGELTAGIAHEIQNPLNFVNNFSEVNAELIAEMKQEIANGDLNEIAAIASDIDENSRKINLHGKRADAIVKGMLQHSRTSSGQKELTDINALADEYLRLAYHGLRAKDKEFNAELITHYDEKLPKVDAVPQDIGRVLLNLINNAFYAVQQRSKAAGADADYEPKVELSTAHQNGSVIISVKDNGTGIPDSIKEKIMQPFFTTKPTGEGTGLGLSLSYDIVVKGHGGSINVHTEEGIFTAFTVMLPVL